MRSQLRCTRSRASASASQYFRVSRQPVACAASSGGSDAASSSSAAQSAGLPPPPPARTCREAVLQARAALRAFRELQQQQQQQQVPSGDVPALHGQCSLSTRLLIELPLPVRRGLSAFTAGGQGDDAVRVLDESDWPGGMQQRFRVLRPLVESVLEGYNAGFLGLLESPADGLGVWSLPGMTVAGIVTNATMPSFLKLAKGGFGNKVLEPGHIIVAVNPAWTSGNDVGQLWQRELKAEADRLIRGPPEWQTLYCCKMIRTAQGACGLLQRAFPHPWQLYAAQSDVASEGLGPLLLSSQEQPSFTAMAQHLNKQKQQ